MINLNGFDSSFLKLDKRSYKDIDIYYIGHNVVNINHNPKKMIITKIFTVKIL